MNGKCLVIILGNVSTQPELKYTTGGTAFVNFSIATNEVWKDKDGNQQKKAEFHRIVAWRKLSETIAQYVNKGDPLYLEGRLQTRSWDDKDGNKRFMTEVVADTIQFVGSKKESGNSESEIQKPEPEAPRRQQDDLPF